MRRAVALAVIAAALPAAPAGAATVRSGGLSATVATDAQTVRLTGTATLVLHGRGLTATAAADGAIAVTAQGPVRADGVPRERWLGFGERSDAVGRSGGSVENYVSDGAYPAKDRPVVAGSIPAWGLRDRDDATGYPVPWLLSTRGYGVLIDDDETSSFDLGKAGWTASVSAPVLHLRVFGGPTPADALRRFTAATGRQPAPSAPYAYGPWFQTGQANQVPLADEAAAVKAQRDAGVPVSVAETQDHYLPCGAAVGNADYETARDAAFHADGLAHLTYLNPGLCASYAPVYDQAVAAGVLQRGADGAPLTYNGFVGGAGAAGFTNEQLALFDWTAPGTQSFYRALVAQAVDTGHDGWMEDFGEYSFPTAVAADGTPAAALHNRYPTDYHCALQKIAAAESARVGRPLTRFSRSGWTDTARCTDDVWGGDPSTVFGYDGLRSALRQGLTMGLSGVARWGSDIGGYDSFGAQNELTPELLARWIELGAVSGVMRTKGGGLAIPAYDRPQVWQQPTLPIWRRYTQLRVRLLPYLQAADRTYRQTGLPIMRQLALVDPRDPRAVRTDDELGFGPDLLAAPVLEHGAGTRTAYLPHGGWVDLWRSVRMDTGGEITLDRPLRLAGGRDVTVPAPLDRLPLFARAGASLVLLPSDVRTLSPYGDGIVHLRDREGPRTLLGWPQPGTRVTSFGDGTDRVTTTLRRGALSLDIRCAAPHAFAIQLALSARPASFTVNGRRTAFRFSAAGVLTASAAE